MDIVPVTYSDELQEIVKNSHQLNECFSEKEVVDYISKLAKIEVMDLYIHHYKDHVTSRVIYEAITQAFHIQLPLAPVLTLAKLGSFEAHTLKVNENCSDLSSQALLDLYLDHHNYRVTGKEVRTMINHYFGMNLDGIDKLGKTRISLYSKSQWLVKDSKDLFVIHTGTNDIDVKIYCTDYFMERTGLKSIPTQLQQSLAGMGYSYNPRVDAYYFSNPSGTTVSNEFKGETIDAIVKVTHALYPTIR
ncbi:hypothetical protein [Sporosarcina ureae]|uniref:hypothetical protein n=1 Tax=Sporosarcina ureae TaxID=1571 RepID=UPI0026EB2AE5|nr:hypothetical protein [Sporosarcina ureae]